MSLLWSRFQALLSDRTLTPQVSVTPTWCLAWGGDAELHEKVTWRDGKIAIANVQHTFSPQERFVSVGEVWLSNRSQLLYRLDVECSDIQIVAQLWERWGVQSLSLLEGMFALAIWDRDRQELWLVRDRTGSRTLYYTTAGSTRWIARRLRSLSPYRTDELDLVALRDYLLVRG